MVMRADAPDTEEQVRGGGPEVEGRIRELQRRDTDARHERREVEEVERARLRARNYQRNRGTKGKKADQWVNELTEERRRAQEEEGRRHAAWASEEFEIDQQEGEHDRVAALYSATHPRLPGMDDTSALQ